MIKRYEPIGNVSFNDEVSHGAVVKKNDGRYTLYSDTKILIDALEEIEKLTCKLPDGGYVISKRLIEKAKELARQALKEIGYE